MARQRSHAQWRELFREQAASGLNALAFCRTRGVSPTYFSLRKRQLSSGGTSDDAVASAFAPVTLQRSIETSAVEIRLGTLSLRVPMAVSPRWLVEVLHGLRD